MLENYTDKEIDTMSSEFVTSLKGYLTREQLAAIVAGNLTFDDYMMIFPLHERINWVKYWSETIYLLSELDDLDSILGTRNRIYSSYKRFFMVATISLQCDACEKFKVFGVEL